MELHPRDGAGEQSVTAPVFTLVEAVEVVAAQTLKASLKYPSSVLLPLLAIHGLGGCASSHPQPTNDRARTSACTQWGRVPFGDVRAEVVSNPQDGIWVMVRYCPCQQIPRRWARRSWRVPRTLSRGC